MEIVEILSGCPKGTPLYSTAYGVVVLENISPLPELYPVKVRLMGEVQVVTFTADGKVCLDGECVLFPSRHNRDWSTFKVQHRTYEFKTYDTVVARLNQKGVNGTWFPSFFAYCNHSELYPYFLIGSPSSASECLPYNEQTAKLIGTTDDYIEED